MAVVAAAPAITLRRPVLGGVEEPSLARAAPFTPRPGAGWLRRGVCPAIRSREPLVGNGRDDLTDVLDRRVDFTLVQCDKLHTDAGTPVQAN